MSTWRKAVTLTLLAIFSLVLVGWDIYAVVWGAGDAGDSISRFVRDIGTKYPALFWVLGVICGHLFWPQYLPNPEQKKDTP